MTIDWNAPLELMDGTPVHLTAPYGTSEEAVGPDHDGDYWFARDDGKRISSPHDRNGYFHMCATRDGHEEGTGTVIVRNREGYHLPDALDGARTVIRDLLDALDAANAGNGYDEAITDRARAFLNNA